MAVKESNQWERVEQHLYRLKHQPPTGEWTIRCYVRFKDWKGVSRSFPAGTHLRGARSRKKILLGVRSHKIADRFKLEKSPNIADMSP
jgi:hypothetical protein